MITRRAALRGSVVSAASLAAGATLTRPAAAAVTPRMAEGRSLIFDDQFSGTALRSVWQTRGTEFTDESPLAKAAENRANVADGRLVLSAAKKPDGTYRTGHIATGEVKAEQRFAFTHGYAEATIRFHGLRGMHAAFWLQTTEAYIDGQAECDVAEWNGTGAMWHNLYWREGNPLGPMQAWKHDTNVVDPAAGVNRYGVLWEPDGYTFFVNDVQVGRTGAGASSRPKFLVLSLQCKDFEDQFVDRDRMWEYDVSVSRVAVWQ